MNCPCCKSKTVVPIVYGEKSAIMQRHIEEGKAYDGDLLSCQKEIIDLIHCNDCGFNWTPGTLSSLFMTKLRWRMEEIRDSRLLGSHVVELSPDGKCEYKEYHGSSRKVVRSLKGSIPPSLVEMAYNWADHHKLQGSLTDAVVRSETNLSLQVSFKDGYKLHFYDDDSSIWNLLMSVLEEESQMKEWFTSEITQEDADKADVNKPKPEAVDRKKVDRGLFLLKTRKSDAKGRFGKNGGFVVLAGSQIASSETPSCSKTTHKVREDAILSGKVVDFVTTEDILFKGPSPACAFVTGGTGDKFRWKNGLGNSVAMSPEEEVMEKIRDIEEEMSEKERANADVIAGEMITMPEKYPVSLFESHTAKELAVLFKEKGVKTVTERVREYWLLLAIEFEMWDELLKDLAEMEERNHRD